MSLRSIVRDGRAKSARGVRRKQAETSRNSASSPLRSSRAAPRAVRFALIGAKVEAKVEESGALRLRYRTINERA